MFFKVIIFILMGLKIPCFKFGANVRTLNEMTNNNFSIIFNDYIWMQSIDIGLLKTITMPFEEI